MTSKPSKWTFI